ncbi:magnesium chelatase domain-containing protein [Neobacillus mesonae]|uniref:magnesium chelatase domain-containing protein n=1 Tax=Neobacillus mesonae TaxID=1193713 RepID=UPI002E1F4A38|nr:magnesium chelatase domain-containing protein [Neobacillus mesonae]
MTKKVSSIGLKGWRVYRVQVEVRGSAGYRIDGDRWYADASVKESRERVIAAISHFNIDIIDQKVVVNLSPVEEKKNGPLFDLTIAIAALN